MTRFGTSRIEEGLRAAPPAGMMAGTGEFWSDFKARAAIRNQENPPQGAASHAWRGRALAVACGMLLVASAGLFLSGVNADSELSGVRELKVEVSFGGVLMVNDEPSQSTILWVVDMAYDGEGDNA